MRAFMLLAFLTITGGLAMSEQVAGDDRKNPAWTKREAYDEKVTVREKVGDKFIPPIKDVPACRGELKGKPVIWVWWAGTTAKTPKGSEIIDKDGVTWVVTESKRGTTQDLCYVAKKAEDKKP
jgi:hypothetical protein